MSNLNFGHDATKQKFIYVCLFISISINSLGKSSLMPNTNTHTKKKSKAYFTTEYSKRKWLWYQLLHFTSIAALYMKVTWNAGIKILICIDRWRSFLNTISYEDFMHKGAKQFVNIKTFWCNFKIKVLTTMYIWNTKV